MGKNVYEVEDILDVRLKGKNRLYLIKWKGYSADESTWEPEGHLNCPAIIAKFNSQQKEQALACGEVSCNFANIRDSLTDEGESDQEEFKSKKAVKSTKSSREADRSSSLPSASNDSTLPAPSKNGKSNGISQFFRPATSSVPDSDQQFRIDGSFELEKPNDFEESMAQFRKMLARVPGPPIDIRNDIDCSGPPAHFIYINETLYGPDVPRPDASFLVGCSCYMIDEAGGRKSRGHCCLDRECECIGQNPNGQTAYDRNGRLKPETSVIYECNKKCCCRIFSQPCLNRVIQQGRQVSLTIVKLPDGRGWGVIANHDIPKGMFIDLYLGEVITTREATRRFASNGGSNEIGSYLFDLDYNYEKGTECEYTLDAYRYGNATHFINHSCSPNLKVYPCFMDHLDPRLHSIAFFSSRFITKGEQLTFDYMGLREEDGNEDDEEEEVPESNRTGESRRNRRGPKRQQRTSVDQDDEEDVGANGVAAEEDLPFSLPSTSSAGKIEGNSK